MRAHLLLICLVFSACAAEPPDDPASELFAMPGGLDRHRLIEDADLEGDQAVTVAQIQALLEDQGSALATFAEGGRTAAQWIVGESIARHVSPIYMVARIETESSLIRSGTLSKLRQATGCACPDGAACDPSFAAFGLQVRCAAELVRGYLDDLDAHGATITGWSVGVGRSTFDPCWVVPQNRATAALYTYTPWVGAYAAGCGTPQWGGSSLVALLVRYFRQRLPAPGAGCPLGDGLYCGGNAIAGDPGVLYRCTAGALAVEAICSAGCLPRPAGEPDTCVDATQPCSLGDGLYCGGNGLDGRADTLYRCTGGVVSVAEACGHDCRFHPPGDNDSCD